jgi:hypothetical protein
MGIIDPIVPFSANKFSNKNWSQNPKGDRDTLKQNCAFHCPTHLLSFLTDFNKFMYVLYRLQNDCLETAVGGKVKAGI